MQTGEFHIGSQPGDGTVADAGAWKPEISPDARQLAFFSKASNLLPEDQDGFMDIFAFDRLAGTLECLTADQDGDALAPRFSGDGQRVVYEYLNSQTPSSQLPSSPSLPPPFYDPNGDGYCTTLDVLLLISHLNVQAGANGRGAGEGEAGFLATQAVDVLGASDTAEDVKVPRPNIVTISRGEVEDEIAMPRDAVEATFSTSFAVAATYELRQEFMFAGWDKEDVIDRLDLRFVDMEFFLLNSR